MPSANSSLLSVITTPAYPNPFSSITNIEFMLPASENVSVKLYNYAGQLMETLFEGFVEQDVKQKIVFDGSNHSSGIYLYQITTDTRSAQSKIFLAK